MSPNTSLEGMKVSFSVKLESSKRETFKACSLFSCVFVTPKIIWIQTDPPQAVQPSRVLDTLLGFHFRNCAKTQTLASFRRSLSELSDHSLSSEAFCLFGQRWEGTVAHICKNFSRHFYLYLSLCLYFTWRFSHKFLVCVSCVWTMPKKAGKLPGEKRAFWVTYLEEKLKLALVYGSDTHDKRNTCTISTTRLDPTWPNGQISAITDGGLCAPEVATSDGWPLDKGGSDIGKFLRQIVFSNALTGVVTLERHWQVS